MSINRFHYNEIEYCFFSYKRILDMLDGKFDPMAMEESITSIMDKNFAKTIINKFKLFVKNDGSNGLLSPSGHFIPCDYEGHIYLYCALGIHSTFEKDGTIDLTPDIIGDRFGWIKISDAVAHCLYRPTILQKRTLRKIEEFLSSNRIKFDIIEHSSDAPLNGYNSFCMDNFLSKHRLIGLYDG